MVDHWFDFVWRWKCLRFFWSSHHVSSCFCFRPGISPANIRTNVFLLATYGYWTACCRQLWSWYIFVWHLVKGSYLYQCSTKKVAVSQHYFQMANVLLMTKTGKKKILHSQYVKCRLFSDDPRFARNPTYIFYLQYIKEFKEALQSAQVSLRKGRPVISRGDAVTASMLISQENVRSLMKNNEGYKFMKTVRGTAAYWEKQTRDLFAIVSQLGLPTWFASFSAADQRWPEIAEAILVQQGQTPHDNMTWEEHCSIVNSNPVTACLVFDKRARHILHDIIMSKADIIGSVTDYYFRIEFQQRGAWISI